jgi:hypothetical protein
MVSPTTNVHNHVLTRNFIEILCLHTTSAINRKVKKKKHLNIQSVFAPSEHHASIRFNWNGFRLFEISYDIVLSAPDLHAPYAHQNREKRQRDFVSSTPRKLIRIVVDFLHTDKKWFRNSDVWTTTARTTFVTVTRLNTTTTHARAQTRYSVRHVGAFLTT